MSFLKGDYSKTAKEFFVLNQSSPEPIANKLLIDSFLFYEYGKPLLNRHDDK